jgi:putative membrane protein
VGALASGATSLRGGLGDAAAGARSLAEGAGALAEGAGKVADGTTSLATGAKDLAEGQSTLTGSLKDGAAKIPQDSDQTTAKKATTIAKAVTVNSSYDNQAGGFGEGFAPMFITLALFLGAFVVWMIMRPLPTRALATPASGLRVALAGFLPAAPIAAAQAIVVLAVVHLALGLEFATATGVALFALLTSLMFLALQQAIIALVGSAPGKITVLALLMLQLVTCGGTYPIQTEPALLQAISPFMPMTWAVRAMRLLITGGADSRVFWAVTVLVAVTAASFAITAWKAGRMRTWTLARLHPALTLS